MTESQFVAETYGFPPESYRTKHGDLLIISEIQGIFKKDGFPEEDGYNHYLKLKGMEKTLVRLTPEDETNISRIINWYYNAQERGQ